MNHIPPPETLQLLWKEIAQDYANNLVASMSRRCQANFYELNLFIHTMILPQSQNVLVKP